jgi:hypothetical protein
MPSKAVASIAVGVAFLFGGAGLFAEEPAEGDQDANQAKNLARLNCGAHIDRILPDGVIAVPVASASEDDPAALVLDDNTLSCPLPRGDSTFIITLSRISVLQRFAFINQNAAGQGNFELAVSNYRLGSNDPKWAPVQKATSFGGQRLINLPILGAEAKYVKVTFHVQREGRLAGLALYGSRTLDGFADRHVLRAHTSFSFGTMKLVRHTEDTLNFNFANQYAHARIVYVSSGGAPSAPRMIDDDVDTSFSFAPQDSHPTVIIELSKHQNLRRVSAVYQMQAAQVEVYLLNELPANPGDLASATRIASVTDQKGEGRAAVNFDPRGARYVALRWTPKQPQTRPFRVAEIAAFGAVPLAVLDLEEVPNAFAQTFKPGEGSSDFSNKLGTLANPPVFASPPVLGAVSP